MNDIEKVRIIEGQENFEKPCIVELITGKIMIGHFEQISENASVPPLTKTEWYFVENNFPKEKKKITLNEIKTIKST